MPIQFVILCLVLLLPLGAGIASAKLASGGTFGVVGAGTFCLISVLAWWSSAVHPPEVLSAGARARFGDTTADAAACREQVRSAVRVGFTLRFALGCFLLLFGWDAALAPDAMFYTQFGGEVANIWRTGDKGPIWGLLLSSHTRYVVLNAAVFYVVGYLPVIMIAITSAAGALTIVFAARIGNYLGGPPVGVLAARLAAYFPSLVIWSALNLRDPFIVLAVTAVVWVTIRIKERPSIGAFVTLAAWLLFMGFLRDYFFALVAAGLAAGLVIGQGRNRMRSYFAAAFALVIIWIIAQNTGFGSAIFDQASVGKIAETRRGFAFGAESAYFGDIEITNVNDVVDFLPVGLAYFLFAPFPWAIGGIRQLMTVPEILVWYWMIPQIIRGVRLSIRERPAGGWLMLAVICAIVIPYSLVSANVGTAYRHRAQVLPLFLVLAAVGIRNRRRDRAAVARWDG